MVSECCDGKKVKVAITFGLVALVVFAAVLVVVGERIAPRIEESFGVRQDYTPGGVSYDSARNSALNQMPVNERAAREIKKGPPIDCVTCNQNEIIQQVASQPSRPMPQPTPSQPNSVVSVPTTPRYSVSVFVGTDPKSQEFLAWWHTDPGLQELRKQSNWQAYTRDNPLYKERYASLVPVDQFPAVIFCDPRGGHVYAAGRDNIPSHHADLYREIYAAYEIHSQVQQQPSDPQPVQSDVDAAAMQSESNCPDGNCKPNERRPLVDAVELFRRPKAKDPIESILYWLWNPGEAVLAMLCAFVFFLLVLLVVVKVFKS